MGRKEGSMEDRMPIERHVSAELLLDYLENRAEAEMATRVRAHLDTGCARCADELATWTRLLATLHACQSIAPPGEVVERAISIIERTRDTRVLPHASWR